MAVNRWLEKAKKVNLLRVQHMQINMDKKAKENSYLQKYYISNCYSSILG